MTRSINISANPSQPCTFASCTNQRTDQSLQKSMSAPTQEKIQNIFSHPSKKIKTPDTQTNPTKTAKLNKVNGLQGQWTERQHTTAVLRNGGCSGKLKVSFSNKVLWWVDSEVLRNPPLRKAAVIGQYK